MTSPSKSALLAALQSQRQHVIGIVDGLSERDLTQPVLPSGWTCLGLIRHLALDVERFWFRAVIAGEQVELVTGDAAWQVPDGVGSTEILALYQHETARADAVIAATTLDTPPAWWPPDLFDRPLADLAEAMLHVLAETATHAGHLDAARELIDGRTWLVLTD